VITTQPSNFWVSGNAALLTKEFYELAKSHLNEDGIILQWIQGYSVESENIKAVIKTLREVFPQAYLFDSMSAGDLFLVATLSDKPLLDFNLLENKFEDEKIKTELGRIAITNPYDLLLYLSASDKELTEYSRNARTHTDDQLFIEYSAPKAFYQNTTPRLLEDLKTLHERIKPEEVIVGGDKKILTKNHAFANDLYTVKIASAADDFPTILDSYKKIVESGFSQLLIEKHIIKRCNVIAQYAQFGEGLEAANKIWEKCFAAIGSNTIEVNGNEN